MNTFKKSQFYTAFLCIIFLSGIIACNDGDGNEKAAPSITSITDINGEVITNVIPGSKVYLEGTSLLGASVTLNDLALNIDPNSTDETLIVDVPSTIPTVATNADVSNKLVVTFPGEGENGEDLVLEFDLVALPGAPVITSISNEFAPAGSEIVIGGSFFFFVEDVVFPGGVSATSFSANADGTELIVEVPNVTQGGAITVTTQSGEDNSLPEHSFMDDSNVITDWDEHMYWQNWGVAPGVMENGFSGSYLNVTADGPILPESWWVGTTAFVVDGVQDSTEATPQNLSGSTSDYVLRFEINVPASKPWTSGWFELENGADDYFGRMMLWTEIENEDEWFVPNPDDIGSGSFHTDGEWLTVEYPLNRMAAKGESGAPDPAQGAQDISELLTDGKFEVRLAFQNPNDGDGNGGKEIAAGIDFSFDNFRVVKITE